MADVKPHEYTLLNEIAQDPLVTQAGLSTRLGMAVGSVNWYVKRLVQRGWVKVSRLDRTRLKYDLTPEGISVFTQRAFLYASDSLRFYTEIRVKAKRLVADLMSRGITHVRLDGNDPMMDILRLTCIECGLALDDVAPDVRLKASGTDFVVAEDGSNGQ
jgi:DNA-binding MarR family transcriptional regulator